MARDWVSVVGTLAGVLLGSTLAMLGTWSDRRHAARREAGVALARLKLHVRRLRFESFMLSSPDQAEELLEEIRTDWRTILEDTTVVAGAAEAAWLSDGLAESLVLIQKAHSELRYCVFGMFNPAVDYQLNHRALEERKTEVLDMIARLEARNRTGWLLGGRRSTSPTRSTTQPRTDPPS